LHQFRRKEVVKKEGEANEKVEIIRELKLAGKSSDHKIVYRVTGMIFLSDP
jgi:hypothetical protein